jgi:hypothetical protein
MNEDTKRMFLALVLALCGLAIAGGLVAFLYKSNMTDAKDIVAVAGLFTGITGTLVGTFLGVHAGASGKAEMAAALQAMREMTAGTSHGSAGVDPNLDPPRPDGPRL